ncbi:MAG: hypothetical protein AB2777_16005 [Candidatus Thiodiazotropha endolucinida]
MKNKLLQALARLASQKYQEAYILNATKDEYVLPEDLVEDVASLCALASRDQYYKKFTEEELNALDDMACFIGQHGKRLFANFVDPDTSSLIYKNEDWESLRIASGKCLTLFGIDVDRLSPEDIDEGNNIFGV